MEQPRRKNLRLQGYDYSQHGAYFITICTQGKRSLFGPVGADSISARMLRWVLEKTLDQYTNVSCPDFVIMPNHVHCVLVLDRTGAGADMESAPTISDIIQTFKRMSTIEYIRLVKAGDVPAFDKRVWQRSFYDHVIRDEPDYLRIAEYISENPAKWMEDEYYVPE